MGWKKAIQRVQAENAGREHYERWQQLKAEKRIILAAQYYLEHGSEIRAMQAAQRGDAPVDPMLGRFGDGGKGAA